MNVEQLLSSLPVAIAVIGYLGYQDWRDGKFKKGTPDNTNLENMAADMSHLRLHFNDDLTRILTEMQIDQKDSTKTLNKIAVGQEEMMKYGVTCRTKQ